MVRHLGYLFIGFLFPVSSYAFFWGNSTSQSTQVAENPIEDSESMFEAIQKERIGNVERLLESRVDILEKRNEKGLTPLLYAIECLQNYSKKNLEEIISILIEKKAFLEAMDASGDTALLKCCIASENPYWAVLAKKLIEKGADIEARNAYQLTPLFKAVVYDNLMVLKILIENNANKDVYNVWYHQTPLMMAAQYNKIKIVEELLKTGASVDSKNLMGMTPLMFASFNGNLPVIEILLQYNADIEAKSTSNVSIFLETIDERIYSEWVTRSSRKEWIVPEGSTAFDFARQCEAKAAAKLILEAWAKKDPTMERALIEWEQKLTR